MMDNDDGYFNRTRRVYRLIIINTLSATLISVGRTEAQMTIELLQIR